MATPQTNTQSVSKSPALIIPYGVPKTGKTTDIIYSLPRSFYFARPAALKPSVGVVGYEPAAAQIWYTSRVKDMTALLPRIAASKDPDGRPSFDAVVVDDFSILVEESYLAIKAGYKGSNKYEPWTLVRQEVLDFINAARACGLHVILNCHEAPPKTKSGHTIKGGPKLPTDMQEIVPALADMVLRAFADPNRKGPWKMVYRCTETDLQYISGDRHGFTPDMAPMNMGEILRMAGFSIRRAPGLEWMDPVAERVATLMLQDATQETAHIQKAIDFMRANFTQNDLHIRWALRDGLDRFVLRKARSNLLSAFLSPSSGAQTFTP